MDIFESTIKLKKHFYKGNPQLVKINGNIERTPFSPLPFLYYFDEIKNLRQYKNKTTKPTRVPFLFNPDMIISSIGVKNISVNPNRFSELTPNNVNTKEYWNFLHENFPFCDVCSYYNVNDINSYFNVKGRHYDGMISQITLDKFRGKKILEIGPGYGYLPKVLKENGVKCQYFCADIVERFNHDNFIDIDGYTLSNINEKFDIVFMYDVIQHLGSEIFKTYSKQILNMLTDDGLFIIGSELRTFDDHIGSF